MKDFWKKIDKPFFCLAPMAGYTDQPFRIICKKYGADVVYSEMVSSEALFHNASKCKIQNSKFKINVSLCDGLYKTLKLIQSSEIERPYVVQIFGANPEHMAFAADYIASGEWYNDFNKIKNTKHEIRNLNFESLLIPDGIDINMGCPAKDVIKSGAGVALMKDQLNAIKIVKAIKKKIKNIPISVKTRLGWSKEDEILEFSKLLENSGIDALAIHGRTYKQGFTGQVNWRMITKVKKQLKIPVIGNGGIKNVEDVANVVGVENDDKQVKRLNKFNNLNNYNNVLDGYMIGMGALGRPWVFEKIKKIYLEKNTNKFKEKHFLSDKNNFYDNPSFIRKNALEHAKLIEKLKGDRGIVEFRKHLLLYSKGLKNSRSLREKLVKVGNLDDIRKALDAYLKKI